MSSLSRSHALAALYLLLTAISGVMTPVSAAGSAIDLSNQNTDQARDFTRKTLEKIDASYYESDDTEGFAYRMRSRWYSPYSFDIFIGSYGPGNTMLRIDAPNRMGYALTDVFAQENGQKDFPRKYTGKSWLLGDALTLISPSLGYLYTNTGTPFAPKSTWTTSLIYMGIDAILLWVGGKTFFVHGFDPLDRGLIATSILMGGFRLYTLAPHHMQLVAHNRLVGLGYSFRF